MWWYIFFAIIIIAIIIKIMLSVKLPQKSSPLKKEKVTTEPANSEPAQKVVTPKTKKPGRGVLGTLNRIAITIVVAALAIWLLVKIGFAIYETEVGGIDYSKKTLHESDVTLGVSHTPKVWTVDRTETIHFTNEYGEIYRGVSIGTNTSSKNLTEDVWVKNKSGEVLVLKGEDIFLKIGNSTDNNELRFKSANGKTGSIDIVFWK